MAGDDRARLEVLALARTAFVVTHFHFGEADSRSPRAARNSTTAVPSSKVIEASIRRSRRNSRKSQSQSRSAGSPNVPAITRWKRGPRSRRSGPSARFRRKPFTKLNVGRQGVQQPGELAGIELAVPVGIDDKRENGRRRRGPAGWRHSPGSARAGAASAPGSRRRGARGRRRSDPRSRHPESGSRSRVRCSRAPPAPAGRPRQWSRRR